ncbi:ribonuclease 3-like protein 1 [Euphorbia lathyris]|uniref:ribonuclease 3-like protein 1 n=1 Tax=Euphorbia lathyris TaxID=212925 RepID=UPI003313AC1E
MENKCLNPIPNQPLNNLPPLPPSGTATKRFSDQAKPISEGVHKFDDEANTVADLSLDKILLQHNDVETNINLQIHHHNHKASSASGEGNRVSAKSKLLEICTVYKWKPPSFECCKQEGPPHLRLFSFKVAVEIEGENGMSLECFGAPKPKKITAAEHAAEGALWYLNHFGYLSVNKLEKKGKNTKSLTS